MSICEQCTRSCKMKGITDCKSFLGINRWRDHMHILSWINYMSHKAGEPNTENVNFDNRDAIVLPSGKKVRITIKVEELE